MSFNFGASKITAAAPPLNFGAGDNKTLNTQTQAKAPAFGSTFATPASTGLGAPAAAPISLKFGATPVSASPFPAATPTSAAPAKIISGGFSLNTATPTNTSALGQALGQGQPQGTTPASSAPSAFNLGGTPASTGISFGGTTGLSLGGTTTSAVTVGFSLGKPASTTTATPLLNTTTTALALPASGATTGTTVGTTATAAPPAVGSLNFNQIEEVLNKWTLELEEQGKVFINQALQLNAWDRLVIANGEKILTLNNGIEKVKQQQQQLDHELEFVLIQQRELEECIAPLEKELKDIPIADHDRNHTYQMAENMDTQLKQMSEDLKEIIEHLNESNKSEDSNDPVSQIGRILNAHMNSLQWIDRNTAQISTLLDQITKMHDMHRRENERSFHLTYE